jgi:UDP-galactopyranose mutase
MKHKFLIVGAGFSGLVLAERLSNELGTQCTIIDKRNHIGGNSQDEYNDDGILIHKYGPHYFRTNSTRIIEYLSRFTEWHPVDYKILSYTDGKYWKFPINLNTFEQYLERESTTSEFEAWLESKKVPIAFPQNSEEVIVSQVGWELYRKFFENYTIKQWKKHPRELDASVCGRIPIRTNRDDRYLQEDFQALPKHGYHKMFKNMLAACKNTELLLGVDFKDVASNIEHTHIIWTGPIDEYFNFMFGKLPYRSLRFEHETHQQEFYQPAMQINYPNDEEFTRIVEIKHATGQKSAKTTIVKEFPDDYTDGKIPYYPIPTKQNTEMYMKYKEQSELCKNVSFVGRLATYRYYNMDQVIGMALTEFDRLSKSLASS